MEESIAEFAGGDNRMAWLENSAIICHSSYMYCTTNKEAIDALKAIKTYCAADLLDKLDYAISVLEKLEKDGVAAPLDTDFTALSCAKVAQ